MDRLYIIRKRSNKSEIRINVRYVGLPLERTLLAAHISVYYISAIFSLDSALNIDSGQKNIRPSSILV